MRTWNLQTYLNDWTHAVEKENLNTLRMLAVWFRGIMERCRDDQAAQIAGIVFPALDTKNREITRLAAYVLIGDGDINRFKIPDEVDMHIFDEHGNSLFVGHWHEQESQEHEIKITPPINYTFDDDIGRGEQSGGMGRG